MKLLPFIVAFLIGTGVVHAQESSMDKEIDQRFALADKNKDGKLTFTLFEAVDECAKKLICSESERLWNNIKRISWE